jgi:2-polyprenyl-6-hydroxyphenyl methylase / 3-demethylubiquinone-9 3-methyltransferase
MRTQDPSEVLKFESLSAQWWDLDGPFKLLHLMNNVRVPYIKKWAALNFSQDEQDVLFHKEILDIGCGGGILSVSLARLGGNVTGLDAAELSIDAAKHYANSVNVDVRYIAGAVEQITNEQFDIVSALEIVEHVANFALFIEAACRLTKKGGLLFISTINRTIKSYAQAIMLAEYVLRLVPKETHNWHKFIKPSEIFAELEKNHFQILDIQGLKLNVFTDNWYCSSDVSVNYIMVARKR